MVTEIASASAELFKLINNLVGTKEQQEISDAKSRATLDVENFKQALCFHRVDRVNLQLGGLQHGILVRLTDPESAELVSIRPEIDGATLLALYARGRAADLAAELGEIYSTSGAVTGTTGGLANAAASVATAFTKISS